MNEAQLLPKMMDVFWMMQRVHNMLHLLFLAGRLPLSDNLAERKAALESRLLRIDDSDFSSKVASNYAEACSDARRFLTKLRDYM
ncbi:hypothetical protein [Polycladidibacter hongkongensis]|uniref:hypothetical protein n=1 Tax=Polycladidibacter hongkongensis TaxID=1647556 RepID=UPI0012E3D4A4|nr:hypothetical protein [Pseudovibrio hongkongensis]